MGEKMPGSAPSNNTENHTAQFIKEYSRENSPEDRDEIAAAIRGQRQERDKWRVEHNDSKEEQEKLVTELNVLREKIEEYNSAGFLDKITDYLDYRQLKATLEVTMGEHEKAEAATEVLEGDPPEFDAPKRLLAEFYKNEEGKWSEAGYTKEDIQKYFSTENLSKLNVEEYALLMRRFPGEMVTHVTRQGVRDHASTSFHSAGIGEFHNGFKSILEAGCIRSSLGISLQEKTKEDAVFEYMHFDKVDNLNLNRPNESKRSKALSLYRKNFEYRAIGDVSAVHVAAESVMNEMYGGETGNEIFFAYPSAHIAAEYQYSGFIDGSSAFDGLGEKSVHNDSSVYSSRHEGMSLSAALLFLPEDAQVDSVTGSKYETTERSKSNEKAAQEINSARFDKLGFVQTFGQQLPWQLEGLNDEDKNNTLREAYDRFGIIESQAQELLLNKSYIKDVINGTWGSDYEHEAYEKATFEYLNKDLNTLRPPKNTITSREYWENYFAQNPDQRPSKVVYYKGDDPSVALNKWRRQNGIIKKTKEDNYGFPENEAKQISSEVNKDRDRLAELALKIIDDRFPESEAERITREEEEVG